MNIRLFVEKKEDFRENNRHLEKRLKKDLHLKGLTGIRHIQIYDLLGIDEATLKEGQKSIFSDPVTDEVYEELNLEDSVYVALELLPGQYDQRAASAKEALFLISKKDDMDVIWGEVYLFTGNVDAGELERIKEYLINPIENREKDLERPLGREDGGQPVPEEVLEGFVEMPRDLLRKLYEELNLVLSFDDFLFIRDYFKEEGRNPTLTEIRVLNTYWSDHCRHTTFETELKNITFEEGLYKESMEDTFKEYLEMRKELGREDKPLTLMDLATIFGRYERRMGRLDDLEISEEINACSVEIDVDVDGERVPYLLMFKNETHNHPTEIEPFGGAATCLGGAIRDPLSGRSYVYQAMRITGAGDIREPYEKTIQGKLSQEKISTTATKGYSSYGNQIGLATTFVKEIYHEGYKAKHMEVGMVVGAAPKENVRRETPQPGDIVLLLGGRTGRDGIGGATGSSKKQTETSLMTAGSEVQKGNPIEERKLGRLFRQPEVSRMIKKCNDFGAGGASVAITELADSLVIDLDQIPLKYQGLSGGEIALSESQERMAVVIEAQDEAVFRKYAEAENIEVTHVAEVTADGLVIMQYGGEDIVSLKRSFLDTNGVRNSQDVVVKTSIEEKESGEKKGFVDSLKDTFSQLNSGSQQGMVTQFDSTIGRGTVLLPYGGRYEGTPSECSIEKIPLLKETTTTCSIAAYGYEPTLFKLNPYLGAQYSMIEAVSRIVAAGGSYEKIRFSFQEYFPSVGRNSEKWGLPLGALLGALKGQKALGLPAIGGKDSMSGTFGDIEVPATLIAFGATTGNIDTIISPEIKEEGSSLYYIAPESQLLEINYENQKNTFAYINALTSEKRVLGAISLKKEGLLEALGLMAFGNRIGISLGGDLDDILYRANGYGAFVVETKEDLQGIGGVEVRYLGTTGGKTIDYQGASLLIEELENIYKGVLDKVYPQTNNEGVKPIVEIASEVEKRVYVPREMVSDPLVYIPVFPGTNCEYDTGKAFHLAGGRTETVPFNTLNQGILEDSVQEMAKHLKKAQILMLSGGFSAGDEPDGSGKFIVNVLLNPYIREAMEEFLQRDTLVLGICNGFQALVKSGLLPYGRLGVVDDNSPTLFYNTNGRHIAHMVDTKIISTNSPWLLKERIGRIHRVAVSHGEGKFMGKDEVLDSLFKQGQVFSQYVDLQGHPTLEEPYNPNGSFRAIEGIMSPDGRILGKMAHNERYEEGLYKNCPGDKEDTLFASGIAYFKN